MSQWNCFGHIHIRPINIEINSQGGRETKRREEKHATEELYGSS